MRLPKALVGALLWILASVVGLLGALLLGIAGGGVAGTVAHGASFRSRLHPGRVLILSLLTISDTGCNRQRSLRCWGHG